MQDWYNIWKSIKLTHHINRIKKEVSILIDVEKAFNKIQHLLVTITIIIVTHSNPGIEEKFLNLMKGISEHPTTNITLNDERLNAVPISNKARMFKYTTFIQHYTSSVSPCNNARKRN